MNSKPSTKRAVPEIFCVTALFAMMSYSSSAATHYVSLDSPNPRPPYINWATAARVIQDAVDAASAGDEIVVTNGVYATGGHAVYGAMTNRVAVTKPLSLRSVNGPQFTIIKGAKAPGGGNGDGAVRCVYLANGASLSGFTLTNGATLYQVTDATRDRDASGGGVWCASTNAVLTNCVMTANSADWQGGGAWGGTLYGCEFTGNSAYYGGGVNSSVLENCVLSANSAHYAGGGTAGACRLKRCTLTGNSAGFGGGTSYSSLENCSLTDNSAGSGGGAESATLRNCALTGNTARDEGGAAVGSTLFNCTLTGNTATSGGGVSSGALYNCIVYFNRALSGANYAGSSITFDHCFTTPLPAGPGNADADPQLADLAHLSSSSPCIGAGSSAHATGVDLDNEPWADPPAVGADQTGPTFGSFSVSIGMSAVAVTPGYPVWLTAHIGGPVNKTVWDFGDGTTLTNRPSVRHAWNSAGTYVVGLTGYNDSNLDGVAATVVVTVSRVPYHYVDAKGVNPVFPYTSWETAATTVQEAIGAGSLPERIVRVTNGVYRTGTVELTQHVFWPAVVRYRVALTNIVTVQSVNGPEVTVIEGAPDGVGCAFVGDGSVLSGFTLTKGGNTAYGGGASCEHSGVVTNCVLTGNSTVFNGGGAYRGTLYNCTLTGNWATNWAGIFGGGGGGGAAECTLRNCVLTSNLALWGGASSGCTLYNCTLTGNSALFAGGGVYSATLNNSIAYFNEAPDGANYYRVVSEHSCSTPLPPGEDNLDADPHFVNGAAGDFRLRPDSPCINTGSNDFVFGVADLAGNPRIIDGTVDMGAYEYDPMIPFITRAVLTPEGMRFEWLATALGSTLQHSVTLNPPDWQDVPGSEAATTVTVPVTNASEFFRLVKR